MADVELNQNLWERWFPGNPFDTGALSASASALLPIAKAIVGREMKSTESRMLLAILRAPGGGRTVVESEIGVGKTASKRQILDSVLPLVRFCAFRNHQKILYG